MKKIIILILIIFMNTGCSSYIELNDLSIVSDISIDYKDNNYILIVNIIDGELDDQAIEKNIITYSSKKETLEEAFQDIYLKSNKRLYLSHLDLLILTKDAINYKLTDIINNFLDNNEYRNNFNIVLIDDDLDNFISLKILTEDINNLIKTNQNETGYSHTKDFETVLKELLIDNNTYLPTITTDSNILTIKGFTLIKDYKVYKNLTLEESIILNMLENNIKKAFISNSNILENQTLITTNKNNIYFKFITTINEVNDNYKNLTSKKINNFLEELKNDNYDVLKLSDKIRKNNYNYYKDNNNLLSKLTYHYDFYIKIKENYLNGGLNEIK